MSPRCCCLTPLLPDSTKQRQAEAEAGMQVTLENHGPVNVSLVAPRGGARVASADVVPLGWWGCAHGMASSLLALLLLGQEGRTLGPSLPHIALAVKTHHHFSSAPVLAQALEAHKRKCRRTARYVWI